MRSRRFFWPLLGLGALLEAAAAASLAIAAFSKPLPRGSADYAARSVTEILGRPASLQWSTDKGFLIASALLAASGLATFVLAARNR